MLLLCHGGFDVVVVGHLSLLLLPWFSSWQLMVISFDVVDRCSYHLWGMALCYEFVVCSRGAENQFDGWIDQTR